MPSGEGPEPIVLDGVSDLASGALHQCALFEDGRVECWGKNQFGALGDPSVESERNTPGAVPGVADAIAIDARDAFYQQDHTCVIRSDRAVLCWGNALSTATEVPALAGARMIAVGDHRACALIGETTVRCVNISDSTLEVEVELEPVVALDMTWHSWCAATASAIHCSSPQSFAPTAPSPTIAFEVSESVVELASTWDRTCARSTDGQVVCLDPMEAGSLDEYQGLENARHIFPGDAGICVLSDDSSIRCISP